MRPTVRATSKAAHSLGPGYLLSGWKYRLYIMRTVPWIAMRIINATRTNATPRVESRFTVLAFARIVCNAPAMLLNRKIEQMSGYRETGCYKMVIEVMSWR